MAADVRGQEALDATVEGSRLYLGRQSRVRPITFTRLNLGTALTHWRCPRALEQFRAAVGRRPFKAHYGIGVLMEAAGHDRGDRALLARVKSDASYVEARMQLADALRRPR